MSAKLVDDPRFSPAGVLAPKNNADLAFVMHSLSWLANDGVAAMLTFPGALYRQGAEQRIRKYLVDMQNKGLLRREGSKRSGHWVVLWSGGNNDE